MLAATSGASMTFAFAPFNLWPLTLLGLTLGLRQLHRVPHSHSFKLGWSFGLGWFGAGVSWVHVSIADFGGLPLIGSLALMALLCGYLALYPALVFKCLKRFDLRVWPLVLPLFWLASEWLRSWLLTGFPWLSLGYSQLDSPLSGWFPVIGEVGVTVLLVMVSAGLACASLLKGKERLGLATLALVVSMTSGYILNRVNWVDRHNSHTISMVQGNIAQSLRWVPEQDDPTMDKYWALTEPLWSSDLIIWPEAAIPKMEPLALGYLLALDDRAWLTDTALITGIVNYNFETDAAWNNLIVVGKEHSQSNVGHYRYNHHNRYAKHSLLPIGEFVPFESVLRQVAPIFDLPMSSFSRGDYQQANLTANGIKLAPAICFEIVFPHQLRANIHSDTDILITVSNDAWFGRSHGPAQHMEMAQVRAKEFGKPLLRATNNGITAFVDERGRIISRLPQFEAGSLTAQVHGTRGATPYWRFGDLPIWIIALLLFTAGWKVHKTRQL